MPDWVEPILWMAAAVGAMWVAVGLFVLVMHTFFWKEEHEQD